MAPLNDVDFLNPRRFFQPITDSNIDSVFGIPTKFAFGPFGQELGPVCTLKLFNGQERKVSLVHDDGGNLVFKDGWPEFVKLALADYGYFMVFYYVGDSTFEVTVFGHTGCEVRVKPELGGPVELAQVNVEGIQQSGYSAWLTNNAGLINSAAAAGATIPVNPYFFAKITVFNLTKAMFNIPISFGREFLQCVNRNVVKLLGPDGRQWKVKYCLEPRKSCSLSKGFSDFAKEVDLEVGDICIFEFIAPLSLKFQVVKKYQLM